MEPLPETREALSQVPSDIARLLGLLLEMGEITRAIVPDCVGLSLGLVQDRLTFTLVATGSEIALLDAAQYVDGGPCVRDDRNDETHIVRMQDPLDEERWSIFARAGAVAGVGSSLSLPVVRDDVVVGGINLYASTAHAFDGRVEALATALGADATAAVTNADLSFSSRREATQAPARLRDRAHVDMALGIMAARYGESVDDARTRLTRAAARAGISEAAVARLVVELHAP
jgi:GAF domain-containing protein